MAIMSQRLKNERGNIFSKPQFFALQKKPDWALGEKEGKSKSTSEAPAEAAEVSPKTESFYT